MKNLLHVRNLMVCFFLLGMAMGVKTYGQSQSTWKYLNPKPMGMDVLSASFINDNTGWAVGGSGAFAKTIDGGATWTYNTLPLFTGNGLTNFRPNLTTVQFLNATTGYAAGGNGAFLKTTDGGNTWVYITGPNGPITSSAIGITNMHFFDTNTGWVIGNAINATSAYIYKTTNGGVTWSATPTAATVPAAVLNKSLTGIDFTDQNTGYICGQSGKVIKTINGGATWTDVSLSATNITTVAGGTLTLPVSQSYSSVVALDANTAVIASLNNGVLARTTDGGANWYASANQGHGAPQAGFRGMSRSGQDTILVAAGQARVIKSIDRGLTWTTTQFYTSSTNGYNYFNAVAVSPVNPRKYFLLGASGVQSYSSDGGTTWSNPYASIGTYDGTASTNAQNINTIDFSSASNGMVAGAHGTLATTTDGGQTWTDKSIPAMANSTGFADYIDALRTPAANVAYIGTIYGYIQKSTDNGNTWTIQMDNTTTTGEGFLGMDFINATTGWACSDFGSVYKTTNGTNWVLEPISSFQLNAIDFVDANNGWVVANSGRIYHTSNGGTTWVAQVSGITNNILSVQFLDANTGFTCGAGGKVLKTTDGGTTWTQINSPITTGLNKVFFTDNTHGFVFGDNGVCFATKDAGASWNMFYAPTTDVLSCAVVPGGIGVGTKLFVAGGSLFGTKGDIFSLDLAPCTVDFITQPSNTAACAGTVTNFNVTTSGSFFGSYQWQISTDGGTTYTDIAGATSPSYTFTAVATQDGNRFRCKVTSACAVPTTLTSSAAILSINAIPTITTPVANTAACAGSNATFTAGVSGAALTYQWQQSINGGTTFTNIAGANFATYTFPALITMDTYQFRCVVTGICSPAVTTAAGILSVSTPVAITAQPTPVTQCAGNNASFSVAATGTALTYQWQVSTDGGTTFSNISGATSATYSFVTATTQNNNKYRCLVTGGACNATTTTSLLVVNAPAAITAQPTSVSACLNSNTGLSVTATGTSISYQWQQSTDNGASFTNITGATAASLPLNAVTLSMTGNIYRCVIAGAAPCGSLNSANVVLTVNAPPAVAIRAATNQSLYPGLTTTIVASGFNATNAAYSWFHNGNPLSNGTVNSIPVNSTATGTYYVVVTDNNGCVGTSNSISIGDSVSNKLFIYPNPNTGFFHVNYYNAFGTSNTARILNVYDAKGARVYSRTYNTTGAYGVMDVDIRRAGSGIYMVQLLDGNGKALAVGKVMVQ